MSIRYIVSVIAMVFLATAAVAETKIIVQDNGGEVQDRVMKIMKYRDDGVNVKNTGICASACVMFLSLPNTCTTKDAYWGFHGSSGATKYAKILADIQLKGHIPPRILNILPKDWLTLTGEDVYWYRGHQLIKLGVPEC